MTNRTFQCCDTYFTNLSGSDDVTSQFSVKNAPSQRAKETMLLLTQKHPITFHRCCGQPTVQIWTQWNQIWGKVQECICCIY